MKRWMVLTLMVVPVIYVVVCSKGKEGEWRWSLAPIPQQQTVSDEDGVGTAITVRDQEAKVLPAAVPRPKHKRDWIGFKDAFEEVLADLKSAIEKAKRGEGPVTMEVCLDAVKRFQGICERVQKPNCRIEHEWEEIDQIRVLLRSEIPREKPQSIAPLPKERKGT